MTVEPSRIFSDINRQEMFECIASGGPNNMFQWTYQGSYISDASILTIDVIGIDNVGTYVCTVTNDAGYGSNMSSLYSKFNACVFQINTMLSIVPPIVELSPSDERVAIDGSVLFTCDYNSAIPVTVTWYHNGDVISNNIVTNDTTSTLSLYDIALANSGTYTCGVENDAGATNASAILQVGKFKEPFVNSLILFPVAGELIVELIPSDAVLLVHYQDMLNLTCDIGSNVAIEGYTITWTRNNVILDYATQLPYLVFDYSNIEVVSQGGVYQCSVSTSDGVLTASSSPAIVAFAPLITEGPQSMSTTNGSYVEFNCTAAGYPAPILEWYRVSSYNVSTIQDIMSSAVELPYSAENNTIIIDAAISYSTLTIDPVYYSDYGHYICVATFPSDSIIFVSDCCNGSESEDITIPSEDISKALLTGKYVARVHHKLSHFFQYHLKVV